MIEERPNFHSLIVTTPYGAYVWYGDFRLAIHKLDRNGGIDPMPKDVVRFDQTLDLDGALRAIDQRLNDEMTTSANIETFTNDAGTWLVVSGELFGPFTTHDEAIDAVPEVLRTLP